jgi:hypothetical protein
MKQAKRCGLTPTDLSYRGLHAPAPPWDFRGILPPNNQVKKRPWQKQPESCYLWCSQPDYLSDDPIPRRVIPIRAACASDHCKINKCKFEN